MQRRGRSVMTENERTESTLGNGCFFYASDSGGGAIAVFGKPPNRERDRRARSLDHKCVPKGRFLGHGHGHPLTDAEVLFYSNIADFGKGWQRRMTMTSVITRGF